MPPISTTLIPQPQYLADDEKVKVWRDSLDKLYDYIITVQDVTGWPPSYRQIVTHFDYRVPGLSSTCGVHARMKLLEKYGFIQFAPNGKSWRAVAVPAEEAT